VGTLSIVGGAIIFLSFIGCFVGITISGSALGVALSVFGLVGGCYIGYLGIRVDALVDESIKRAGGTDPVLSMRIQELEKRVASTPEVKSDSLAFDPPHARVSPGESIFVFVSSKLNRFMSYHLTDLAITGMPNDMVLTWGDNVVSEGRWLKIQTSSDTPRGIHHIQFTFSSHESAEAVTGILVLNV
jgi:hypothetical protein